MNKPRTSKMNVGMSPDKKIYINTERALPPGSPIKEAIVPIPPMMNNSVAPPIRVNNKRIEVMLIVLLDFPHCCIVSFCVGYFVF